ncbi:MAG: LPS export ABC transporter periplasmic protein LptC [Pseudomonadota bacterium]
MNRGVITNQMAVEGYSRWIKRLKILLPLASLLLIATIFLIGRWSDESLFSSEELAALGAGMQLENPRFTGTSEDGNPFVVTALRANPDGPAPEVITLDQPRGEMDMLDGRILNGRSDKGVMLRSKDELTLTGNVVITTSDGYRADMEKLIIDIDTKSAAAPVPVTGFGPSGSIASGSFRAERPINRQGQQSKDLVLWFENGVRVIFIPERSR